MSDLRLRIKGSINQSFTALRTEKSGPRLVGLIQPGGPYRTIKFEHIRPRCGPMEGKHTLPNAQRPLGSQRGDTTNPGRCARTDQSR